VEERKKWGDIGRAPMQDVPVVGNDSGAQHRKKDVDLPKDLDRVREGDSARYGGEIHDVTLSTLVYISLVNVRESQFTLAEEA
jgi:hypothetical protein